MGLFDKFRKKNSGLTIEEIISKDYELKCFDECKYIWKNYVPAQGQANSLQGELLREIEKIRCEAQDNGNINWDDDYSYFCDFISKRLCEQPIFTAAMELNRLAQLRGRAYENMLAIATCNYPTPHPDCNGHSIGMIFQLKVSLMKR